MSLIFPTLMLPSGLTFAAVALLALRFAAFTATRRSMVEVRSNPHRPAGSRSKAND